MDEVIRLYGHRWPPILLSVTSDFQSDAGGVGAGRLDLNSHGQPVYVTGTALINKYWTEIDWVENAWIKRVVMHELAHVFGLGHTSVPGNLMYVGDGRTTSWGPGDLAGFHALTKDGCVETPTPRRI